MDAVPPAFFHGPVPVLENVRLAERTWRIRLAAPALAAALRPGQFLMARLAETTDPLLGRPFALYDTVLDAAGQPAAVDVVYLEVGKMTGRLAQVRGGERVEVWGPLGNTFPDFPHVADVALVAGGIGQTPFLAYTRQLLGSRGFGGAAARRCADRVRVYYGVRTASLAAGVEDFRLAGAETHLASDDGSLGHHGFVTQLLDAHPRPEHIIGCGPEPMLRALMILARAWQIPCHLSLETPMACGVGICFSCVTRVKTADGWDYQRVCVDGPVFDAAALAWEA